MWISSHCGIYFNEVADNLGKKGCDNEIIEFECTMDIALIKSEIIRTPKQWELNNAQVILASGSNSMRH